MQIIPDMRSNMYRVYVFFMWMTWKGLGYKPGHMESHGIVNLQALFHIDYISWKLGASFANFIHKKKHLPNQFTRFSQQLGLDINWACWWKVGKAQLYAFATPIGD